MDSKKLKEIENYVYRQPADGKMINIDIDYVLGLLDIIRELDEENDELYVRVLRERTRVFEMADQRNSYAENVEELERKFENLENNFLKFKVECEGRLRDLSIDTERIGIIVGL